MAHQIIMPRMMQNKPRGRIVEWRKREGDRIKRGDPLFVIENQKANTYVEAKETGILARILVPAGVWVSVPTVAGIITAEGEEITEEFLV